MKVVYGLLIAFAVLIMAAPAPVVAQNWYGGGNRGGGNYCPDLNHDGICDNAEPNQYQRQRNQRRQDQYRRNQRQNSRGPMQGGPRLEARWSSAGPLHGAFRYCIHIGEPAEPRSHTWGDDFLCFNRPDHGFRYSYAGRIPGMHCESFNLKGGVWADNYICSRWKDFAWFPRALRGGYRCIRITESADPDPRANGSRGYSNHFCLRNDD